ncbi:MAG: penicillin-binding transpeptidase domain-containing protein, partial [bacterium]
TRDRLISPQRGEILDRNGEIIATNESVYSISVINAQVKDPETTANILASKLELDYNETLEKINKKVALERIKTKVDKDVTDEIRNLNLEGVMIDEDIKRIYPHEDMASQVIGFVGKDNQGIIGLEAMYDEYLEGSNGKILTETDARGIEMITGIQERQAPTDGYNLVTSIDLTLQKYAEQTLEKVIEVKEAQRGAIILMNPQNGEIYAMANEPDFDLNEPFTINDEELLGNWDNLSTQEQNDALNQMWRNFSINDTYEPGSTFKILTSAIGLEENIVTPETMFTCSGGHTVGGIYIKCWRSPNNHGVQTFTQGVQNSCNPVFMQIVEELGAEIFYDYMEIFGLTQKTGVDLAGEASGIMHKEENLGEIELATMSFGQSFQITPLQLLRAISSVINGGNLITPHFGIQIENDDKSVVGKLEYPVVENIISEETSEQMKKILESVVAEGTGNKTYIEGFRIGGKTATSEKLPRRSGKYIASFSAFAPAEEPELIALVIIDEPQGVYYGGQVAGPVMKEIMENALPYLGVEPIFTEGELENIEVGTLIVPDFIGMKEGEVREYISQNFESKEDWETGRTNYEISIIMQGEGDIIKTQFPPSGIEINKGEEIILYK